MEREYNVPLRHEWLKVQKYKRSQKAVKALKEFLVKHMKSENVKLGKHVNEAIWARGIKNPPHHVKVLATKDKDGVVNAELVGIAKKEAPKAKAKKAEAKAEPKAEAKPKPKAKKAAEEKTEAPAEEPKDA